MSLLLLQVIGCIVIGQVLDKAADYASSSFGGMLVAIPLRMMGKTMDYFGYMCMFQMARTVLLSVALGTIVSPLVESIMAGSGKYFTAMSSGVFEEMANYEYSVRDSLTRSFGPLGTSLYYYVFDGDYTVSRLAADAFTGGRLTSTIFEEEEYGYFGI